MTLRHLVGKYIKDQIVRDIDIYLVDLQLLIDPDYRVLNIYELVRF